MKPSASPLRLDSYFFKRVQFALSEGFDLLEVDLSNTQVPAPRIEVTAGVQNPANPLQWRFDLDLELPEAKGGRFPYSFFVTVVGYFTVSEQFPVDKAEMMVRANAPALLYSSAREFIVNLTGRGLYSPFLMPSVTFVLAAQEKSQKRLTSGNAKKKIARKSKKK